MYKVDFTFVEFQGVLFYMIYDFLQLGLTRSVDKMYGIYKKFRSILEI